jgi:phenylalanyl-tRNA synthetase beta chain
MKVSLNTIKQYVDISVSVEALVQKINEQLGGVEEVVDLADVYKDAVIVKVTHTEKHPNADKLSVCMIDDGGVIDDVERDEQGHVRVVCGAPNVHSDMLAVWLPPRSTVPASHGTDEPFVLDARELRGIKSNGMLAAADELAIGTDHNGIIEINADEWTPYMVKPAPGASFAAAYGLDDTVIDIENKMFTHRPDCFGQLGVAREIAGITGQQFTSPEWYTKLPEFIAASGLELTVTNEVPDKVPRFMAVAINGVAVEPSPLWMQCELMRLGSKSINNIVDVTNYIMLLTGQPTHAYDYDKLRGHQLGARMARDGEELSLLNGKTYSLTSDDIVIVDGEGAVGLAGIMGGGNSEVSADTTKIVLEVANFDMYAVRKTSMRHGVFTDALTRFNKGQSSLQQPFVMGLLMSSTLDVSSGSQASNVYDMSGELRTPSTIVVAVDFINARLGLRLTSSQIAGLLRNVEFQVDIEDDVLTVAAGYWRTDIQLPEDIVEEVGRLYGFDALPRELPHRSIAPAPHNVNRAIKQRIRESLRRAGSNEVLTYSFVHEQVMKHAGQDVSQAFRVSNALSPDLQYYRLSVLPSLLDKVHANVKAGYDEFTLFEIGKGHNKKYHVNDDEGLPSELEFVDAVYTSKQPKDGSAYYYMRHLLVQLAKDLWLELTFTPITEPMDYPVTTPFDLSRSALVETRQGEFIGMVGELKQQVSHAFKLPAHTAAMSLDLAGIEKAVAQQGYSYAPLSKYPAVAQDISLKVASTVQYSDAYRVVQAAIAERLPGVAVDVSSVGVYQAQDDPAHKTITLHVECSSYEKTLSDSELNAVLDYAADRASEALGAVRT